MSENLDTFERCSSAAVCDVLERMGCDNRVLSAALRPVAEGASVAGVAYPVTGLRRDSIDPSRSLKTYFTMIDAAPDDALLVCNANDGGGPAAVVWDLAAKVMEQQRYRGAVVDWGIRDADEIRKTSLSVWARAYTPRRSSSRWKPVEWDELSVVNCVAVSPGDVIVADTTGVVAIPEATSGEVLDRATAVDSPESEIRQSILDGDDASEILERHGAF